MAAPGGLVVRRRKEASDSCARRVMAAAGVITSAGSGPPPEPRAQAATTPTSRRTRLSRFMRRTLGRPRPIQEAAALRVDPCLPRPYSVIRVPPAHLAADLSAGEISGAGIGGCHTVIGVDVHIGPA